MAKPDRISLSKEETNQIRKIRRQKGMTAKDVSESLGLSAAYYRMLEINKLKNINYNYAIKIFETLDRDSSLRFLLCNQHSGPIYKGDLQKGLNISYEKLSQVLNEVYAQGNPDEKFDLLKDLEGIIQKHDIKKII